MCIKLFRQTSDFICPSRFWVETPEEKERLLTEYKVYKHITLVHTYTIQQVLSVSVADPRGVRWGRSPPPNPESATPM